MNKIKLLISMLMILIVCSLAYNVISISLDYNENSQDDFAETGWFVYPLLEGFYKVQDWEVAVCLHEYLDKSNLPKEKTTMMDKAMSEDYQGQILSITADLTKNVPTPADFEGGTEDETGKKTTNLYTVCWVVLPMSGSEQKYSVYLKGEGAEWDVVENQIATPFSGSGDCKLEYSDSKFKEAYLSIGGGVVFTVPIMDKTDLDSITAVEWS